MLGFACNFNFLKAYMKELYTDLHIYGWPSLPNVMHTYIAGLLKHVPSETRHVPCFVPQAPMEFYSFPLDHFGFIMLPDPSYSSITRSFPFLLGERLDRSILVVFSVNLQYFLFNFESYYMLKFTTLLAAEFDVEDNVA